MNSYLKVLITGTNKGIGNELVKVFLKRNPQSIIYATSRELTEEATQRWKSLDHNKRVQCRYLDIALEQSISQFAKKMQYQGVKFDVVINNAGVGRTSEFYKPFPSVEWTKECLNINVLGHIRLTQKILPYLTDKCKIANISSMFGALKFQPLEAQQKFSNPNITKQDILDAVQQCIKGVENQNLVSFSPNIYFTSKMLLCAWSRFVVQNRWLKDQQISICVTPGLCLTPMTSDDASILKKAHSAESGAQKIHQTLFFNDLDPNVFYHRARKSDFYVNGDGLPWE